jgi:hypothetical protein
MSTMWICKYCRHRLHFEDVWLSRNTGSRFCCENPGPNRVHDPVVVIECGKRSPWSGRRCVLLPGHAGAHSPKYPDADWEETEATENAL